MGTPDFFFILFVHRSFFLHSFKKMISFFLKIIVSFPSILFIFSLNVQFIVCSSNRSLSEKEFFFQIFVRKYRSFIKKLYSKRNFIFEKNDIKRLILKI